MGTELTKEQLILVKGFSEVKELNTLTSKLLSNLTYGGSLGDKTSALIYEAIHREPGVPLRNEFSVEEPDNRARVHEVDKKLQSYYGYIRPAMRGLIEMGLNRPYGDMWLDYFRRDCSVYRVNVVCCMCAKAALLSAGVKTRAGTPTRFARTMDQEVEDPVPDTVTIHASVSFEGGARLSIDTKD